MLREEMLNKKIWIGCFVLAFMLASIVPVFAQPSVPRPSGAVRRTLANMGEIIIGNYWQDYNAFANPPFPGWVATEAAERELEHRRRIQEEFNFRISTRNIASWSEMPQVAMTSIMAGRPAAHVFVLQPDWAMALQRQNLLFPLNTARTGQSNVHFNRDNIVQWNRTVNSAFSIGGNQYAFTPGYGGSQHASVVFFNKRLFREAGLPEDLLYDLQAGRRVGEFYGWTWDTFLEIARRLTRDINNNGIIDTFAMTADFSIAILDALVAGNNAAYVARDPRTGLLVNATGRPEFLEALNFAVQLQREGIMMPSPEGSNWDWFRAMFNDGRVAMRLDQEWVRGELQHMRDDWGMVVPPRGPRARDFVVFTSENVMVIPRTFNREQVEAILWAVQAWHIDVNEDWRHALFPIFRDIRAVNETMAIIRDPRRQSWRYHMHVPGLNVGNIAWEMWWFDGEPAQLVESVSNSWNLRIMDANGL